MRRLLRFLFGDRPDPVAGVDYCVKCLAPFGARLSDVVPAPGPTKRYCSRKCPGGVGGEHFHMKCWRCGYAWRTEMRPA